MKCTKNRPEELKEALCAFLGHLFGEHQQCGDWCQAQKLPDPSTYTYSSLPRGKPLQSADLHVFLEGLFSQQASNAAKLAPCGTSNLSESLNQTFTSLAPKRFHFSWSEAYDYRLGCGITSKNIGNMFIPQALESGHLSPGKHTQACAATVDGAKAREHARRSTRKYARRRLELRAQCSSAQAS